MIVKQFDLNLWFRKGWKKVCLKILDFTEYHLTSWNIIHTQVLRRYQAWSHGLDVFILNLSRETKENWRFSFNIIISPHCSNRWQFKFPVNFSWGENLVIAEDDYNEAILTSLSIQLRKPVYKISWHPGILTPKIAGGSPDFLTWESAGLPCFTPVCTSIYGTDMARMATDCGGLPDLMTWESAGLPCFFP